MRDSPAIAVVQALVDAGARVRAYDPEAAEQARPLLPPIDYAASAYEAMEGADALVVVTPWDAFRALDLRRVRAALARPVVVDLRNIFDPEQVRAAGLEYTGIGR